MSRATLDFLKVVRLVFWSGVVGPGTSFRSLALRARTIALRAHSRATRSKARLVSKSSATCDPIHLLYFVTPALGLIQVIGRNAS